LNFLQKKVNDHLGPYSPTEQNLEIEQYWEAITSIEMDAALSKLSNKKSAGLDLISGFFLKIFGKTITPYACRLFNLVISCGKIPGLWKIARITPVYKKGDPKLIQNYRPVSNLLTIAKLFELCLINRLSRMDADALHGSFQHGFRKSHSTCTAVGEIISSIVTSRDEKNLVSIYSADLTAAFDLLRKEILVDILKEKLVPKYLIRSIHSYLTGRMGYVQVGNGISCIRDIRAGCIQGSVIGPILFNIYTSRLNEIIFPHRVISYADDSYVIISADTKEALLTEIKTTSKRHIDWLKELGMVCNASKIELLLFGMDEAEVEIDGSLVSSRNVMKVLGLMLDNKFSWEANVKVTLKRCRAQIFALRFIRKSLSIEDTMTVLRAHIIRILTYCSPVWSHAISYSARAKLRSIFYLSIRTVIRDFGFEYNRAQLLAKAKIESLDDIFFLRASMFVFKIVKFLVPTNIAGEILSKTYANARHPSSLTFFDTSKSRVGKKCFTNEIRNYSRQWGIEWLDMSIQAFKQALKQQLNPRIN